MENTLQTHREISTALCGELTALGPPRATVRLVTDQQMRVDTTGLVHGGFVFGAADHAAMAAVNEETVVLIGAQTRFLKPTRAGSTLMFEAQVIHSDGNRRTVEVIGTSAVDNVIVFRGEFSCYLPAKHVLAN